MTREERIKNVFLINAKFMDVVILIMTTIWTASGLTILPTTIGVKLVSLLSLSLEIYSLLAIVAIAALLLTVLWTEHRWQKLTDSGKRFCLDGKPPVQFHQEISAGANGFIFGATLVGVYFLC